MLLDLGLKMLEPEINSIQESEIRKFVVKALTEVVPIKFFFIPSSSTGKYHPQPSADLGGLLRHVKCACYIGAAMCEAHDLTQEDKDFIQAALILHDIGKPAKDHPMLVRAMLMPLKDSNPVVYEIIVVLIESHHGRWGTMPLDTLLKEIVHLADYISSRKDLIFTLPQNIDYSEFLF